MFTDDEVTIREQGGARLLLPKDWPVEEHSGVQSPIPIEQYLRMKFGQVKEAFSRNDQRLADLERRLEALEREDKLLRKRFRLLEERFEALEAKEVADGHTSESHEAAEGAPQQSP